MSTDSPSQNPFARAIDGSLVISILRVVESSVSNSRLTSFLHAMGDWARASYLYWWLNKEPDPDVIVIDLRETITVGPIIALFDRTIQILGPYWQGSRSRQVLYRLTHYLDHLAQTRLGRACAKLLEPPEPPESSDR